MVETRGGRSTTKGTKGKPQQTNNNITKEKFEEQRQVLQCPQILCSSIDKLTWIESSKKSDPTIKYAKCTKVVQGGNLYDISKQIKTNMSGESSSDDDNKEHKKAIERLTKEKQQISERVRRMQRTYDGIAQRCNLLKESLETQLARENNNPTVEYGVCKIEVEPKCMKNERFNISSEDWVWMKTKLKYLTQKTNYLGTIIKEHKYTGNPKNVINTNIYEGKTQPTENG